MFSRRSIMAAFAALPFAGALFPKAAEAVGDGVALKSVAHPIPNYDGVWLADAHITLRDGSYFYRTAFEACTFDSKAITDFRNLALVECTFRKCNFDFGIDELTDSVQKCYFTNCYFTKL